VQYSNSDRESTFEKEGGISVKEEKYFMENYKNCTSCSHEFKNNETFYLGYGHDQSLLYVCKSCSEKVKEIVLRGPYLERRIQAYTVQNGEAYTAPNDESILWRYMDFSKYVSLISTSKLFFSRADTFTDNFEGARGLLKHKDKLDTYLTNHVKAQNHPSLNNSYTTWPEEELENTASGFGDFLEQCGNLNRKMTYINCWHESEFESEAMWQLYSNYIENAIAVKTTCGNLHSALLHDDSIEIGRVQYIDYNNEFTDIFTSLWRKRKSFEHEKEVRALITPNPPWEDAGRTIKCDLSILIDEVIVSPFAPKWFESLVQDVSNKYGISEKVTKSEMSDEPFY
jgi:hypothetical protein